MQIAGPKNQLELTKFIRLIELPDQQSSESRLLETEVRRDFHLQIRREPLPDKKR